MLYSFLDETFLTAEAKFKAITEQGQRILTSKEVKPAAMKTHLATIYSPKHSHSSEMIDVLLKCRDTVDGIFVGIEQCGLCNYINYFLLDEVMAEFLEESEQQYSVMKDKIKAYEVMLEESVLAISLEHSCQRMKLPLQAIDTRMKQYFTQWILILELQQNELKLSFVDYLRYSLAIEFEVPRSIILLFNIELSEKSLTTIWRVPQSFQVQITTRARAQSCLQWCKDIHLLTMKIGENICYQVAKLYFPTPSNVYCVQSSASQIPICKICKHNA